MKRLLGPQLTAAKRSDLEIIQFGELGTGMNGIFEIFMNQRFLRIISGSDEKWEHVSVSMEYRCPSWQEMCFVKDLFWHPEETVIQFHPPKSQYVNTHPYVLHLWKPLFTRLPIPDMWRV